MYTAYASMVLPPGGQQDGLVMVPATEALRLRRHGFAEVPRPLAWSFLGRLGRREALGVRSFLARMRVTGTPLAGFDDTRLLALLRTLVAMREVVVLRAGEVAGGAHDKALAEQRKLVRDITSQTRGRLSFDGRQFRLTTGEDLPNLPDRDAFEVVPQGEAKRVLGGIARQSGGGTHGLPGLLTQAQGKLTRDWRPPLSPDGLVLLRRVLVRPGYKPAVEPALTPSALKKLKDEGWIEVVFVDAGMEPIADADYDIKLADGGAKSGKTDKKGSVRVEGITPGECQVSFPGAKGPVALV